MSLRKTTYDVGILLGALRVPYSISNLIKNVTTQYIVDDFGVVVSVLNSADYSMVSNRVDEVYKNFRQVYVATSDDIDEKRYEIIWALMQSGYMMWLRFSFGARFPNILETDGLADRIINERLRRWDNMPMYSYLIQYNMEAKQMNIRRLLAQDPSFFDYMPQ